MVKRIITGELGVNTYLYNFKDNNIVLIDPGSDEDEIINSIESEGYCVKGIILTHGHFDHIGAISPLKEKYNCKLYIHRGDAPYLGNSSKVVHQEMLSSLGIPEGFMDGYYRVTPEPDEVVEDGDKLEEFGLKVIHTPGHSRGSICLYSEEDQIVFTGDTLFNGGLGRTDFPGGDYQTLLNSLENLLKLPGNTTVYPGHGGETKIENERGITQLY